MIISEARKSMSKTYPTYELHDGVVEVIAESQCTGDVKLVHFGSLSVSCEFKAQNVVG